MCDEAGGCCRGPTVGPEAGNFRGVCPHKAGGMNTTVRPVLRARELQA